MSQARIHPQKLAPVRPPWLAAALAALAVAGLYALTLAPTTQFWDASEYIATAHILGIPHPPGNPLFVVLARAWDLLLAPTGLPVAVRINLFSALMGALAHGLWFLIVYRVVWEGGRDRGFALVAAAAAVLVSATAFSVWNQSNVNEKVYTLSMFTIALLVWLALVWRDRLGRGGEANVLLLMVFLLALSVGNHLMAFLAAPALLLFVLLVRPRALLDRRTIAGAVVVALIGLSIHLFLPLRAGLDPIINEADPSSWTALAESLARRQYDKPSVLVNPLDPTLPRDGALLAAQFANYGQYFDWQWARSLAGYASWFGGARPLLTLLFVGLGLAGALEHRRRDRASALSVGMLFLTLSAGLVLYLNFRYGFSYPLEPWRAAGFAQPTEVRERDYFFMAGFSVWGVWAGLGVAVLWRAAARRFRAPRARLLALPVLALALIPLAANWRWASRAGDWFARDFAYNVLMSVEPYGVLFTNGDNDTFPLWYLQEVEGVRRDVTVIVTSYLNAPWYPKQLRQLTAPCAEGADPAADPTRIICQRRYDATIGAPVVAARPPEDSILPLADADIDRIAASAFVAPEPLRFRAASLETTIPAGTTLLPSDTFVTAILASSLGRRPVHFIMPAPSLATLNLREFAVRTGLTVKLSDRPVVADGEIIARVPESEVSALTGAWVDIERTDTLAREIFRYRGAPAAIDVWADAATRNIPPSYAWMHLALAQAHAARGDRAAAAPHYDRAQQWLDLARLGL
jgi:hypothetical protein